jgi:uncharacterized oxidoreductase
MNITGNTILVTGGGSGIGRGLAEALHKLGNQVVIAGRRQSALNETTAANPGMKSLPLDIENPVSIKTLAKEAAAAFPTLNVLVNNAGIMRAENLNADAIDLAKSESIVAINLLGPIRLTAALLPLLKKQPHSTVMNVSSGLAFVPLTLTPTYCATKAAIHSYTQSLRYQLRSTTVEVLELIPPYVATDLMGGADDPRAMPLSDFLNETMTILKQQPTPPEICVERVKPLRHAADEGRYAGTFQGLNASLSDVH